MKVLFDTNVILDILLDRQPFSSHAVILLANVELGEIQGFLCATTITTLHYLIAKTLGAALATEQIEKLLQIFEVAPVNRPILEEAVRGSSPDFEDAVIHASAKNVGVDVIVTRNMKGFRGAQLPILAPPELVALLRS